MTDTGWYLRPAIGTPPSNYRKTDSSPGVAHAFAQAYLGHSQGNRCIYYVRMKCTWIGSARLSILHGPTAADLKSVGQYWNTSWDCECDTGVTTLPSIYSNDMTRISRRLWNKHRPWEYKNPRGTWEALQVSPFRMRKKRLQSKSISSGNCHTMMMKKFGCGCNNKLFLWLKRSFGPTHLQHNVCRSHILEQFLANAKQQRSTLTNCHERLTR